LNEASGFSGSNHAVSVHRPVFEGDGQDILFVVVLKLRDVAGMDLERDSTVYEILNLVPGKLLPLGNIFFGKILFAGA
jgi:hypothetical protein